MISKSTFALAMAITASVIRMLIKMKKTSTTYPQVSSKRSNASDFTLRKSRIWLPLTRFSPLLAVDTLVMFPMCQTGPLGDH